MKVFVYYCVVTCFLVTGVATCFLFTYIITCFLIACVGERCGEVEGSRLEAWMKSHKSEVAIT